MRRSRKKKKKEEEIKNSLHRYRRRNNEPYQRFFAPVIDKRALHLSNLICHYPWIMIRLSYQTKSAHGAILLSRSFWQREKICFTGIREIERTMCPLRLPRGSKRLFFPRREKREVPLCCRCAIYFWFAMTNAASRLLAPEFAEFVLPARETEEDISRPWKKTVRVTSH